MVDAGVIGLRADRGRSVITPSCCGFIPRVGAISGAKGGRDERPELLLAGAVPAPVLFLLEVEEVEEEEED